MWRILTDKHFRLHVVLQVASSVANWALTAAITFAAINERFSPWSRIVIDIFPTASCVAATFAYTWATATGACHTRRWWGWTWRAGSASISRIAEIGSSWASIWVLIVIIRSLACAMAYAADLVTSSTAHHTFCIIICNHVRKGVYIGFGNRIITCSAADYTSRFPRTMANGTSSCCALAEFVRMWVSGRIGVSRITESYPLFFRTDSFISLINFKIYIVVIFARQRMKFRYGYRNRQVWIMRVVILRFNFSMCGNLSVCCAKGIVGISQFWPICIIKIRHHCQILIFTVMHIKVGMQYHIPRFSSPWTFFEWSWWWRIAQKIRE